MSLKFRDEAERQEVARRHADVYQRARDGEITLDEAMRLSRVLLEPYQKEPQRAHDDTIAAHEGQE